jgi:hypothetical protein
VGADDAINTSCHDAIDTSCHDAIDTSCHDAIDTSCHDAIDTSRHDASRAGESALPCSDTTRRSVRVTPTRVRGGRAGR